MYDKLLLWRSGFRTFHLHRHNNSNLVNINGQKNNAPHCRLLLLPTTFKAHSNRHFCTKNTTTSTESNNSILSDQIENKLPDPIEQQCEKWLQFLRAELEAGVNMHKWMNVRLMCTEADGDRKTCRLHMSTEMLSPEQLGILRIDLQVGDAVELNPQQFQRNHIGPPDNANSSILGTLSRQLPNAIVISVNRFFNLQERQWIQQSSFNIRKTGIPGILEHQFTFLAKRQSNLCKLPGYSAMLQAFNCQPLPKEDVVGLDPVDWVGSHGTGLDPSQCVALGAALNLKQPLVAVHGPPGSGKTLVLAEYLHILHQQGKRVLVFSPNNVTTYNLLGTFCKKFPSVASCNGTFLGLNIFNAQLASKVIADEAVERLIGARTIQLDQEAEMQRAYYSRLMKTQKSASMEQSEEKQDPKQEAEGHKNGQIEEIGRGLLQSTSILFTVRNDAWLNLFILNELTFDVIIIDDAVNFTEFEIWWKALPTAPVLRLFGDYNQQAISAKTSIGRKLNVDKSLLQRLDEQCGSEVNFHLQRQYRSNAAIQAWPNLAFYGQRAAVPDESVRDIRLDDLFEEEEEKEGKLSAPPPVITDPLVLVDLSKLEGEWREWMFKTEKRENFWLNWGEAFLTAFHLYRLFEHLPHQLCPSKVVYLTHKDDQRGLFQKIFSKLPEFNLQKFKQIRLGKLQGQQFDVLIKDSLVVPTPGVFSDPHHLKLLNFEMCRARRQFIWLANSNWLEEGGEQSRQLLHTFREHGRIVGPNELLPLVPNQFQKMIMKVQENDQKMWRDRRMRNYNERMNNQHSAVGN